jgi:ABC-2 type transport system permease protein/sodium transport system permease protein
MSEATPRPAPLVRRLSGFSFARQWRLTRKELAETLRDRRTIVTLVIMPLLVYPLLSIIFRQFLATSLSKSGQSIVLIGVEDKKTADLVSEVVNAGSELLGKWRLESREVIEPPLVEEPADDNVQFQLGPPEERLKSGQVDVAIYNVTANPRDGTVHLGLIYSERSPAAAGLRSYLERRIRAFNVAQREALLGGNDLPPAVQISHEPLPVTGGSRSLLPAIVPLVLLMMTITGAVYPAIDLTAGERERGTLESLIAAPVSRLGVLMAKYVAVLTVALLTAGMNLAAMSITIYSSGLMSLLVGPGQHPLMLVLELLGLLLLFASFFSALLLVVTSFAKSFKEAQAYLIPLMLVTLAPGLLSLSPTLELSLPLAVTPLVNVVLLARDVFAGSATMFMTLIVATSTILCAACSIALAARIFGSDAILYGSGGSWSDLFRRSVAPVDAPSLPAAAFCLAIVFAAMINLGGAGSLLASNASPAFQVILSSATTVAVFAAIPLLAVIGEHVRPRSAFRMRGAGLRFWLAAIVLGGSLGVLAAELTALLMQWDLAGVSEELKTLIEQKAAQFNALPLPLILTALAVVPAVAEELFFRGYLFRATAVRWGGWSAVGATALLFALFHAFGASGITLQRIVPSLLMGVALGALALRSGSVLPGMILHSLNNALLLLIARYKEQLVQQQFIPPNSEDLPTAWLAAAAVLAAIGAALLLWPSGRGKPLAANPA